jgi:DNA-binding MarR family transcriptional regulator
MMKKIELDSDLLSILLTESFNSFTVLELRSAYLAIINNPQLGPVEARKFVYRHILRLEKKGLLERKHSEKRDRTFYKKTKHFSREQFEISESSLRSSKHHVKGQEIAGIKKDLLNKLNQYKLELLTSIGETDEYKSLCSQFPDLTENLQKRYNHARDNSSKILGRIKALESLMNQQLPIESTNATS